MLFYCCPPSRPSVLPLPLPVITWLVVIFCCRTFYGSHSRDCWPVAAAAWLNLSLRGLALNQQPSPACATGSAERRQVWRTGPIMTGEAWVGSVSGKRECGYSQVLWAGFNICGRWGCERRIIASGLVTDGAGLSVNRGQGRALSRTFLLLWSPYLSCTMSIRGGPVDGGNPVQLNEAVFMLTRYHICTDRHLCNGTATDVCNVYTLDNQIWSLIGTFSWPIISF